MSDSARLPLKQEEDQKSTEGARKPRVRRVKSFGGVLDLPPLQSRVSLSRTNSTGVRLVWRTQQSADLDNLNRILRIPLRHRSPSPVPRDLPATENVFSEYFNPLSVQVRQGKTDSPERNLPKSDESELKPKIRKDISREEMKMPSVKNLTSIFENVHKDHNEHQSVKIKLPRRSRTLAGGDFRFVKEENTQSDIKLIKRQTSTKEEKNQSDIKLIERQTSTKEEKNQSDIKLDKRQTSSKEDQLKLDLTIIETTNEDKNIEKEVIIPIVEETPLSPVKDLKQLYERSLSSPSGLDKDNLNKHWANKDQSSNTINKVVLRKPVIEENDRSNRFSFLKKQWEDIVITSFTARKFINESKKTMTKKPYQNSAPQITIGNSDQLSNIEASKNIDSEKSQITGKVDSKRSQTDIKEDSKKVKTTEKEDSETPKTLGKVDFEKVKNTKNEDSEIVKTTKKEDSDNVKSSEIIDSKKVENAEKVDSEKVKNTEKVISEKVKNTEKVNSEKLKTSKKEDSIKLKSNEKIDSVKIKTVEKVDSEKIKTNDKLDFDKPQITKIVDDTKKPQTSEKVESEKIQITKNINITENVVSSKSETNHFVRQKSVRSSVKNLKDIFERKRLDSGSKDQKKHNSSQDQASEGSEGVFFIKSVDINPPSISVEVLKQSNDISLKEEVQHTGGFVMVSDNLDSEDLQKMVRKSSVRDLTKRYESANSEGIFPRRSYRKKDKVANDRKGYQDKTDTETKSSEIQQNITSYVNNSTVEFSHPKITDEVKMTAKVDVDKTVVKEIVKRTESKIPIRNEAARIIDRKTANSTVSVTKEIDKTKNNREKSKNTEKQEVLKDVEEPAAKSEILTNSVIIKLNDSTKINSEEEIKASLKKQTESAERGQSDKFLEVPMDELISPPINITESKTTEQLTNQPSTFQRKNRSQSAKSQKNGQIRELKSDEMMFFKGLQPTTNNSVTLRRDRSSSLASSTPASIGVGVPQKIIPVESVSKKYRSLHSDELQFFDENLNKTRSISDISLRNDSIRKAFESLDVKGEQDA